ncbi:MAG: PPOX class F420-dependent oxidoreductase [Acidimicrobiia bacterium]|nr:PPOX class F420-dependent oxidoreductase [Acidimicrobiia bacterium]
MSDVALRTFIADRHRGVLITLRSNGRSQSSNIAYATDNHGVVRISVTDGRAKTANLRRDPRASLHVNRDDFWAYTVMEATAELTPVASDPADPTVDELVELYRAMQGEHPDWDEYRRAMVDDGRLVVRLHPERFYGMVGT